MICPKNDRGVISPYPTVVIAVERWRVYACGVRKGYDSLTRTNQAAVGMDCFRVSLCNLKDANGRRTVN